MARKQTGDNPPEDQNTGSADGEEKTPNIQADHNSLALGSFHVEGDVDAPVVFGHGNVVTVGFTAEQASAFLEEIRRDFQPKPFDGTCPYKGLDVFTEDDVDLFFGRESIVKDLVSRVNESRAVFVTGASGSGKSSLVRAGLIPALKKAESSRRWLYAALTPERDPFEALARAFSRLKDPSLGTYFREHNQQASALNDCAESALSDDPNQRLVLFVDQFEEVFTQLSQDKTRRFIDLIDHAATVENGRLILLFSLRSDFLSICQTYPQLNALLGGKYAFAPIGAMQPYELASAIAQPALRAGLKIDPALVAQIINDMQGEPGALPLMQFALKDLFDSQKAEGGVIALTLDDYLGHSGIHKALERHADHAFARLSEGEQELARSIFSGLIEIGRGTQDTRRTALFEELVPANTNPEEIRTVVQKLAGARLIITDERAGKDTVTIAHEKLIDAWPWLKKLVNENREAIALQNEIATDAKEWDDHGRDPSYLYTGARLANAREKLEAKKLVLSGLAQAFIETGVKAHRDELEAERQRANQLRMRSVYLTFALAVALIAVGGAIFFGIQSRQQARIALGRQLAAQAQAINTARSSKQMIAVLLAIKSIELFPTSDAVIFLLNNDLSAHSISQETHDDTVTSVAFGPNSKYVVSGSADKTARVWEATTGKEIVRMTHQDVITSVAFSSDGKYIVSGSRDSTARVWEATTGKEIARMTHVSNVRSAAFSPDGRYVVSGSDDGTARVWEATTGKEIAGMGHEGPVYSFAFSPDGKYVVSGSNLTARVWKATTGKEIARMAHGAVVSSVAFSPECDSKPGAPLERCGRYIISGSRDGTARVWEATTGKEIARMNHEDWVISVDFSPDGKYVVSASRDGTARVWEATTGKEIARMTHEDWVWMVAFSPDGRYVVSGSDDGTARVWEATTGKEIAHMTHEGAVFSVAFSLDGRYVVSGTADGTARVWEVATDKKAHRMTHEGAVTLVAFSPDGRYVVSGSDDGTARVWKATTGKEIARMAHEDAVRSIAFSPDGKYIVSGSRNGTVHVWEVATGKEIVRMTHTDRVTSVAFSLDGRYVVSGSDDGTARVWEATTSKEIARMTHERAVRSVTFSPNGKYAVSGSDDGTARVWEANTGKEIARMIHEGAVTLVAFSPDGKYAVSGSDDGTARVWEANTGKEIARMTHERAVRSVTFSPDGRYVVSGSVDGTARVWEAPTSKEIARMTHEGAVTLVAFSADGRYVVSGSVDGTARVWEATTGNEIARMIHEDAVRSVAFSPDDKYVVSGSDDGTARVWMWQPADLIADACSRLPRNLTHAEWKQYIGDLLSYHAICPTLPIEPERTPAASPTP